MSALVRIKDIAAACESLRQEVESVVRYYGQGTGWTDGYLFAIKEMEKKFCRLPLSGLQGEVDADCDCNTTPCICGSTRGK